MTVVDLGDVCNTPALAKIEKTPVHRAAQTHVEEDKEKVFREVTGPSRLESLLGFGICIVFADQNTN